ncbi:DegV family protein [Demequina capsici]|uniref:DegV family protein n=1 Tax=Demequina capsici TaxID=3075620 RepID=A0AA96F9Z3_9MICO|nr:DegV family protein [Demequina sp. OYTSA14]WNM25465.1 DegV family protein [Demequina sp. OYTSA14]
MTDRTVAVITDSSSGLDPRTAAHFGVCVVPVRVITEAGTSADGTISVDDVVRQLKAGAEIRTLEPQVLALLTAFKDCEAYGASHVVAVMAGTSLSEAVVAAESAAGASPVPVSVVDSGSSSMSLGLAALAAGAVSLEGGDPMGVVRAARAAADSAVLAFTVSSLRHIRRSRRMPQLVEAFGRPKNAKPVVRSTRNSQVDVERARDMTVARRAVIEIVERAAHRMERPVVAIGLGAGGPSSEGLLPRVDAPLLVASPPPSLLINTGPDVFNAAVAEMPAEFFTLHAQLDDALANAEGSLALTA